VDRRAALAIALALAGCGPAEVIIGDSPGLARVVAGVLGQPGLGAEQGDALTERLAVPTDVDVAPDGTLYIADTGNRVVREVTPLGVERIAVGDPSCGEPVIAAAAPRQLCFAYPTSVAVGLVRGTLFVADQQGHLVWFVDLEADTAAPFFGTGSPGRALTGTIATQAPTRAPTDVAVGPNGTVYVAEPLNHRVVAILVPASDVVFRMRLEAGKALAGYAGDGGPAVQARLFAPEGVIVSGSDLYIADTGNHMVRRVDASGTITRVAGTGRSDFGGDGGPALSADLSNPTRVAVLGDLLLVADRQNRRLRVVSLSRGVIGTFLGTGEPDPTPDLRDAAQTATGRPEGLAAADGFVYAVDAAHHVVRRVFVP
jgi:sugar lactone lactonase YvrE